MRFYGEMVSEPCGSDLCRFVFAPGKGGGIMSGILLALSLSLSLSLICVANVLPGSTTVMCC